MMKRDECLLAVSAAFGDVRTEAVSGYWNFHISTTPARELVLTESFLQRNVLGPGMTPVELTTHIKSIPETRWSEQPDGTKILAL